MKTLKRWLSSPWFMDTSERVARAYFGAGLLVITGHLTGKITLAVWESILLAGVVPAVSVLFSILSTFRTGPSSTPASLLRVQSDGCVDVAGTFTVHRRRIPERAVAGKPLGRHIEHDSRSLDYLVEADGTVATVRWPRTLGVLNQGSSGSCTGQAATGALGTSPDYDVLSPTVQTALGEQFALNIYSLEEVALGYGPYPPNDNGGSGLAIAKVCLKQGLISRYLHITSVDAAKTAIQTGPFIVGSNWFTPGMDNPSASGLVTATGTVRGGHEYECIGYDATEDLWEFVNSWGEDWGVQGHFFYSSATFAALLSQQGDATVLLPLTTPSPTPPAPTPVVDNQAADAALVTAATPWVAKNHTGANATMKAALVKWLAAVQSSAA